MDEFVSRRTEALLKKLKARTDSRGKAKPGFEQNVAAIRAELDIMQGKK